MKVKICGITNLDDALAACDAGADALGFVFAAEAAKRNRYIAPETARTIIAALPPFVTTVAVTVNETLEHLREYLEFVDLVQLHGEEDEALCRALGARAIQVFRPGPGFALDAIDACPARACLLDAAAPGERGGSGERGDWELARRAVDTGKPIVLAGGLHPENVAEAVRAVRPYAVDVSSGVEAAPGKKDHERVRSFIRNAKLPVA
jgi:phosphoribosylanthranilate isomerase